MHGRYTEVHGLNREVHYHYSHSGPELLAVL